MYQGDIVLDIFYFIVFLLQIFKNFLTDFTPEGEIMPNRNFVQIANRYLYSNFALDFICIIPIHWMIDNNFNEANYLFFIKTLRLIRGLDLLNMRKMKKFADSYFRQRIEALKVENPAKYHILAEDMFNDHNNIESLMYIGFVGQTLKLVFILLSLSYFGGMLWLIWCDFSSHRINEDWEPTFLQEYGLELHADLKKRPQEIILTAMYFMLTTLSTVGFGDLHPKSDAERILCIFVFLIGVSSFTFVMNEFLEIFQ